MDFDRLFQRLPKYSSTWTVDDIEIWLIFIGLENLVPKFRNASVDGSVLSSLAEQDFKIQLGIQSKILLKKIMTWITQGIKNYDTFITQRQTLNSSKTLGGRSNNKSNKNMINRINLPQQLNLSETSKPFKDQYNQVELLKDQGEQRRSKKRQSGQGQGKQPRIINQLVIKQCQSSLASCFSLKQQGGTIGRHSKNQIHIVDQCVSRYHARIQYENNQYYIKDLGSSSGTFLRITEKTRLFHGIIIQMGSNQFEVNMSKADHISLTIIQGPNIHDIIELPQQTKINVGRKATNEINFPDDQHLSNIHSTLYEVEGVWYVQDLGTTNGTWLRLSSESNQSDKFLLENGTQFKLGSNMTYECQKNSTNRKTEKDKSDKCTVCRVAQKNCIFLPCKHNICCLKCAQMNQISHCTVCGSTVNQLMKIFKV